MKITILIISLFFIFSNNMFPQNASVTKNVTLDFGKKTFEKDIESFDSIKQGNWYKLKITNINLNLYKVSLENSDSVIKSETKMPGFGDIKIDAVSKLITGISSFVIAPSVTKKESGRSPASESIVEDSKIPSESDPNKDIKITMNSHIGFINSSLEKLIDFKKRIDSLNLNLAKYILKYQVEFDTTETYNSLNDTNFTIRKALQEVDNLRKEIEELLSNVSESNKRYLKFSDGIIEKIKKEEPLKNKDNAIKESYNGLIKSLNEAFECVNADKSIQLLSSMFLESNNGRTFTSLPMQFNGDIAFLKIKIEPRIDKVKLQTYSTIIKFPKADLSYSGVGASFYMSGLYDEAYSIKTEKVDTNKRYKLIAEEQSPEFGTAVLLRYGWKFDKDNLWGGHFTIGPAISISNKIKPRLIFGGGLSVGNKDNLVIDLGLISGYCDRLSKSLNENDLYDEKPASTTVSIMKYSWFFSVGYVFRF